MPAPFERISLHEFAALLERFPFKRRVNEVHMHHTWRPNHNQYRGHETIESMWRYYTREKGWKDIAQHLTIAPDGAIWLGRNWNLPPASASGHNGNAQVGPFMFEMIGDFDKGRDHFEGKQRETALKVVALVQKKFQLEPEMLRFHNQMSSKSCPGTAIDYKEVLQEVRQLHQEPIEVLGGGRLARSREGAPFGPEALEVNQRTDELVEMLTREVPGREDLSNAEPDEDSRSISSEYIRDWERSRDGQREEVAEISPEILAELRPHVINLRQGVFSSEGLFSTTSEDVDALFGEHLEQELKAAKARGEKLRVVFYAHGGLVSESNALRLAYRHLGWWKKNNVYPIYFVWETGFFETIRQLLFESRQRVARALPRDIWDFTTDPVVEATARALYGPTVWSGMKQSAERASEAGGGALYAAQKLQQFCGAHQDEIELHAIGHSAGAIFQAYFLPAALDAGCPSFRTAHLFAPAIRVDTFLQQIRNRIGNGIDHLSLFTMKKDRERADHCANIYKKSLLYLIYHALEAERKTPILGLEISLRGEARLRELFGLGGAASQGGQVIWSDTTLTSGRSASTATNHGGFDEDAPTMNSVLRRILNLDDNDPIHAFPADLRGRGLSTWENQIDWPEEVAELFEAGTIASSPAFMAVSASQQANDASPASPLPPVPAAMSNGSSGRRMALCIGIDEYPTAPLAGCVADARLWRETLMHLGFQKPELLLNGQATRQAILDALSRLITSSQAGDVVVFQFAGHGTELPDVSGDEAGGDTPGRDEALCAYDFASGAFVIDDDIAEIFSQIPDGVNVTCFIDCCHSGTISRFGIGVPPQNAARSSGARPRFLKATLQMIEAHRQFRGSQAQRRRGLSMRGPDAMREVLFSACLSSEIAWESSGQGEFTMRATQLLRGGLSGMTHEDFISRVRIAFGPSPRQHPELDCAPAARTRGLLTPLVPLPTDGREAHALSSASREDGNHNNRAANTAQLLRLIADTLE